MFIKLKNSPNSIVELRVTIDGIDHWNYTYTCDIPVTNSEKINLPMTHQLGFVSNLRGDVNSWSIELWNVTDQEIEVNISLDWLGGVEGSSSWPNSNDKVKVQANGYKLLTGSCKFL